MIPQAERELFVFFVFFVFVFFSVSVCEEKRRDKVPFFCPFFFLSLSVVFRVSKSEFSNPK